MGHGLSFSLAGKGGLWDGAVRVRGDRPGGARNFARERPREPAGGRAVAEVAGDDRDHVSRCCRGRALDAIAVGSDAAEGQERVGAGYAHEPLELGRRGWSVHAEAGTGRGRIALEDAARLERKLLVGISPYATARDVL